MNRFQAFGRHLSGSLCAALLSATLVFLVWYPGPLALASGVRDIFLLLLLIDVILGPVITFIVFNPQKKELKRDLVMVVMVQVVALLYGLHAVYVARPVYVVFSVDRFDMVFANDLTDDKLAKATNTDYQSLPLLGPKTIAARQPNDTKARNELLFSAISGGDDLSQLPQYYESYSAHQEDVAKRVNDLALLKKFNADSAAVEALRSKYSAKKINAGYLPLRGKTKDLSVVLDRNTGEVLEIVDLRPWT